MSLIDIGAKLGTSSIGGHGVTPLPQKPARPQGPQNGNNG